MHAVCLTLSLRKALCNSRAGPNQYVSTVFRAMLSEGKLREGSPNMQEPQSQYSQLAGESAGSRALLVATIAWAVLMGAGLVVLGTPPAASETGEQVVAWFSENRDAARWFVWAMTVATPVLAVMIALLRRLIPSPYRDVFLIGGVSWIVSGAVFSWSWGGMALHATALEPAIARAVLDVAVFFGPVFTGTTVTMIAPVTILALQNQAGLPRWIGVWGFVAVVEQAVETITIFGSTGFTQPNGAMNFQLGAGLTIGWLVVFGIWGGLRGRQHYLVV